jgi:hypothetical protein
MDLTVVGPPHYAAQWSADRLFSAPDRSRTGSSSICWVACENIGVGMDCYIAR